MPPARGVISLLRAAPVSLHNVAALCPPRCPRQPSAHNPSLRNEPFPGARLRLCAADLISRAISICAALAWSQSI